MQKYILTSLRHDLAGLFLAGLFLAGLFLAGLFLAGLFLAGLFLAGLRKFRKINVKSLDTFNDNTKIICTNLSRRGPSRDINIKKN